RVRPRRHGAPADRHPGRGALVSMQRRTGRTRTESGTMIRILLADDQALVRGALAALLSLEPDIEVVAEVGRGDEAVAAATASGADVCLLDVEMPGADGISVAAELRAVAPGIRSIVVTTFGRPGYVRRALEAGA